MTPFDFLNDIMYNKKDLVKQDPDCIKDYNPWLTNVGLSYHLDTILIANLLNKMSFISKNDQYSFALHSVRQKKRKFNKWAKKINNSDLDIVCKAYNCNQHVAEQYLKLLTKQQLQLLMKQQDIGGV